MALAASSDGGVIVGAAANGAYPLPNAAMWVDGIAHPLPVPYPVPHEGSIATAVSRDGSVAAGYAYFQTHSETALRWVDGVPQEIPGIPGLPHGRATAVSADGSVTAGVSFDRSASFARGWLWQDGAMRVLITPPGAAGAWVQGLSADGQTIVGQVDMYSPQFGVRWVAAIWRNGTPVLLPEAGGSWPETRGMAISGDGSLVVGYSSPLPGGPFSAFVWDEQHGLRNLSQILGDLGVDLAGWRLTGATGVSSDGRTIVGLGVDRLGQPGSWIATIPAPGVSLLFGSCSIVLARRRRRGYAPGSELGATSTRGVGKKVPRLELTPIS
jgi:uncharacterized membrane protein